MFKSNHSFKLFFIIFWVFNFSKSTAEEVNSIYSKRILTVYCNEKSIVLQKIGGDFIESWIDGNKNEWFTYSDVTGKLAIIVKPEDQPTRLCIVSYGKIRNVKSLNEFELPK